MRIPDKTLLLVSLTTSIIGIAGLLLLSTTTNIDDLSTTLLGEEQTETTIKATVKDVQHRGNLTFLLLEGTCTVEAVVYEPLDITTGTAIQATGTIDSYKGKRQLVLEEAKLQP